MCCALITLSIGIVKCLLSVKEGVRQWFAPLYLNPWSSLRFSSLLSRFASCGWPWLASVLDPFGITIEWNCPGAAFSCSVISQNSLLTLLNLDFHENFPFCHCHQQMVGSLATLWWVRITWCSGCWCGTQTLQLSLDYKSLLPFLLLVAALVQTVRLGQPEVVMWPPGGVILKCYVKNSTLIDQHFVWLYSVNRKSFC